MASEKKIKCVIWDLDHTLWNGVLIEQDKLSLNPGIREIITTLDQRGILQSIASKNNHQDAVQVLEGLGLSEYFLFPQIGWGAKSQSVQRISELLNIGQDTLLFIDDQEFELDEVRNELPEVWCLNTTEYLSVPDHPRLNPLTISPDSRRRRLMYQENIKREGDEASFEGPKTDFLASLNMKLKITEAVPQHLLRASELTHRTNQFNSSGMICSEEELTHYMNSPDHWLLICEFEDNYGSYGNVGLALVEKRSDSYHIKLLLVSCRVLSRGIGTILISTLLQLAQKAGKTVTADFRKSDRNRMMQVAWMMAGFKPGGSKAGEMKRLIHDLAVISPIPPYLEIDCKLLADAELTQVNGT